MDLLELFQLLLQACIVLASRALIICSSSLFWCQDIFFKKHNFKKHKVQNAKILIHI